MIATETQQFKAIGTFLTLFDQKYEAKKKITWEELEPCGTYARALLTLVELADRKGGQYAQNLKQFAAEELARRQETSDVFSDPIKLVALSLTKYYQSIQLHNNN